MEIESSKHLFAETYEKRPIVLPGMTLRDYFAAKAMSAQLSAVGGLERGDNDQALELAVCAYEMADAMMQAREITCKHGNIPSECTTTPMDCQCAIDAALAP